MRIGRWSILKDEGRLERAALRFLLFEGSAGMSEQKLPTLDMESVRLIVTLFETLNLSQTAERCMTSVASASRVLSKLRLIFGDELFTRYHLGMLPTARAREIEPTLRSMLLDYQQLLSGAGRSFNPAELTRTFRVGAVDYGVYNYLVPALPAIVAAAPLASVDFRPLDVNIGMQLKSGALDLAVYPTHENDPDIRSQPICRDAVAYVVHASHPLVELARTRTLHESDILRYRFVKTSLIPSQNVQPEDPFMPNQSDIPYRSLETAVWVPYFTQAFECLHGTGLVAMTGLQLAARRIAEGGDYVILGKPSRISDYTPHFLWHVRVDKDPAVQWLRGMFLSEKGRFVDPDDYQSLEP